MTDLLVVIYLAGFSLYCLFTAAAVTTCKPEHETYVAYRSLTTAVLWPLVVATPIIRYLYNKLREEGEMT